MPRKRKGERPDGLIQVTCTDGMTAEGKPRRKSFYGHTRAEAEAKRDQYLKEKEERLDPSSRDLTVGAWIEEFVVTYGFDTSKNTTYLKAARQDLSDYPLRSVNDAILTRSMQRFAGYSKAHAMAYRRTLQNIFGKAKRNGLIAYDPSAELELPKTSKTAGTHRALTAEETRAILDHAADDLFSVTLAFMLFTGIRKGEMIALTWSDIDLDNNVVHIRSNAIMDGTATTIVPYTKSAAGVRDIPITDRLHQILGLYMAPKRGPFYKPRQWKTKGPHATLSGFQNALERYKKLNEMNFRFHDLRHTFATYLYDAGVDLKTAQLLLGHSDVSMTIGLYTHLSEQKKSDSIGKLNAFLDKI